jgi:hypothetical protein
MVTGAQIKLCEKFGATEFVQELLNDGDGELVLHGAIIEGSIIHTQAPGSISLLHQQNRGRKCRSAAPDKSLLLQGTTLLLKLIFL